MAPAVHRQGPPFGSLDSTALVLIDIDILRQPGPSIVQPQQPYSLVSILLSNPERTTDQLDLWIIFFAFTAARANRAPTENSAHCRLCYP